MSSSHSLKYDVESVIIAVLREHPRLRDAAISRDESANAQRINQIVVKATVGPQRLDGPGGFDVDVEITRRITTGQKTTDLIPTLDGDSRAIRESFAGHNLQAIAARGLPELAPFRNFLPRIADEPTGTRPKVRGRTLRLACIAVQK